MKRMPNFLRVALHLSVSTHFILVLFILVLASCGSNSGTSTGDFRVEGLVRNASGSLQVNTLVGAFSMPDNTPLEYATTASDGSFLMQLPGTASQIQYEINGLRTATITQAYPEPLIFSSTLRIQSSSIQVESPYQLQVDSASLCSNFTSQQNVIVQVSDEILTPCTASLLVQTTLPLSALSIAVVGQCSGTPRVFAQGALDSSGKLTVDLSQTQDSQCETIYVQVATPGGATNTARFNIYPLKRKTDGTEGDTI